MESMAFEDWSRLHAYQHFKRIKIAGKTIRESVRSLAIDCGSTSRSFDFTNFSLLATTFPNITHLALHLQTYPRYASIFSDNLSDNFQFEHLLKLEHLKELWLNVECDASFVAQPAAAVHTERVQAAMLEVKGIKRWLEEQYYATSGKDNHKPKPRIFLHAVILGARRCGTG